MYRLVRRASLSDSSGVISALPGIHTFGRTASFSLEATRCSDFSSKTRVSSLNEASYARTYCRNEHGNKIEDIVLGTLAN